MNRPNENKMTNVEALKKKLKWLGIILLVVGTIFFNPLSSEGRGRFKNFGETIVDIGRHPIFDNKDRIYGKRNPLEVVNLVELLTYDEVEPNELNENKIRWAIESIDGSDVRQRDLENIARNLTSSNYDAEFIDEMLEKLTRHESVIEARGYTYIIVIVGTMAIFSVVYFKNEKEDVTT